MNNQPIGPDHQLSAPSTAPSRHKGVRVLVWLAILLIFAVGFVLVLRHQNAPTATSSRHMMGGTVTLTTATAKKGDIGVYIDAIGTVTPVYTTSVTAQVTGIITEVHYREGQIVKKG